MNILILGSGGRESAFASKMAQSSILSQLYIAPGNAGTSAYGKNVDLKPTDFEGIAEFVLKNQVKMVVVGPEEPLVKGIHDFFLNMNLFFKKMNCFFFNLCYYNCLLHYILYFHLTLI